MNNIWIDFCDIQSRKPGQTKLNYVYIKAIFQNTLKSENNYSALNLTVIMCPSEMCQIMENRLQTVIYDDFKTALSSVTWNYKT